MVPALLVACSSLWFPFAAFACFFFLPTGGFAQQGARRGLLDVAVASWRLPRRVPPAAGGKAWHSRRSFAAASAPIGETPRGHPKNGPLLQFVLKVARKRERQHSRLGRLLPKVTSYLNGRVFPPRSPTLCTFEHIDLVLHSNP